MTKGGCWENVLKLKHIRTSVGGMWENGIEIFILTFKVEINLTFKVEISTCFRFLG